MRRGTTVILCALSGSTCMADVLPAHPGPSNNGGPSGWAIFFDLEAPAAPVTVTHLATSNNGAANSAFSVEVFIRDGTAIGGTLATGPGSSSSGWTSIGTAPATQGATTNGVSLDIDIPNIAVTPGQIRGVCVRFTTNGPRYFGIGTGPPTVYQDANLKLTTGDSRTAPFTATGSFFTPRLLVGSITYTAGGTVCYPNCDGSTIAPTLNVQDFSCFLNQFANSETYANCDSSTVPPVLNVQDFSCFLNAFANGCS